MKTFADLKRAIKPGLQMLALEHWNPKLVGTVRTVTRTQTNGYWFRVPDDNREMWAEYFKASCYTFPAPDTFQFSMEGKSWTLQLLAM